MLANNFRLFQETEDKLKRFKKQTGISPNISSRIAFFSSIESGYRYTVDENKPDGSMNLNNSIWFGEYELLFETMLKDLYPELNEDLLVKAWATHVKHGENSLNIQSKL